MSATFYDTLGVEPHASSAEIKKAYRRRARTAHPDHGGNEEEFKRLGRAYETLRDASKRATYDASMRTARPQATAKPAAPAQDAPQAQATEPAHGAEQKVNLDWGVEEEIAVPTYVSEQFRPVPLRRRQRLPLFRILGSVVLGVVIFAALSLFPNIEGVERMTATVTANICVTAFILVVLRPLPGKFGVATAVLNAVALAILGVMALNDPQYLPAVGFVAAMLLHAELVRSACRRLARWSTERRFPPMWESLMTAASVRGCRRLWVSGVAFGPTGHVVTVWDPVRRIWEQYTALPQPLPPHMWVVLDPAGRLVVSSPDKARATWEAMRA